MKDGRFLSFLKLSRAHLWFYQKLTPVLAIAYAQILLTDVGPVQAFLISASLLVSLIGCALYGYFINDWFDIAQDRLAGKPNLMERVQPATRFVLAFSSVLVGFLPFLFFSFPLAAIYIVASDYVLSTLYSTPVFRWKEKPVRAVLLDAAAAHFLPVLLVFAMVADLFTPLSIAACLWAFFNGLRQILLHQLWDHDHDARAGVVTFVRRIGFTHAQSIIRKFIFPAELISFAVLAFSIIRFNWLFVIPFAFYPAIIISKSLVWKRSITAAPPFATTHIPPNDFYESWFPISLVILLVVKDVLFLPLLAAHVLLFCKHIKRKETENMRLIRDVIKLSLRHARTNG